MFKAVMVFLAPYSLQFLFHSPIPTLVLYRSVLRAVVMSLAALEEEDMGCRPGYEEAGDDQGELSKAFVELEVSWLAVGGIIFSFCS